MPEQLANWELVTPSGPPAGLRRPKEFIAVGDAFACVFYGRRLSQVARAVARLS